jgi:macrolide transport system ATP-binding/permease protein
MSDRCVIEAAALHKTYVTDGGEVHAVRGVDLRIVPGEFVAVMGPSGSGKSTLMNLLGLLDVPDRGLYRLGGRDVSRLGSDEAATLRNRMIGFVFQSFNLLGRLTALENVEVPLAYAGIGKAERRSHAMRALESVGLGHRRNHWPRQLSGGEQQRVALVLADDPTGAIDTQTSREILRLFRTLNRDGRTIVIVTHDPAVAESADRIVSMQDGRVVADRPTVPSAAREPANVPVLGRGPRESPIGKAGAGFINAAASVAVAIRSLRANLMRSMLTVLGIVVGVAAVITMVAVGDGANMRVMDQMRSLGSNLLLVQPGSAEAGAVRLGTGTARSLTEADAAAIENEIPGVLVAAPGVSGSAQLVHANRNWAALIGGVTPSYLIAREWRIEKGRAFSAQDVVAGAKVVLLGAATVERLFENQDPLEQIVRIGNVPFTVIGVLKQKGYNSDSGRDQDDVALLPLSTTKLRVLGRYAQLDRLAVDYILVKLANGADLGVAASRIAALLRQRHRIADGAENDFTVSDPTAAIQSQASATRALSFLLSAVSAVSLVVGGIGIMNIMLVSVTERTREVGIRLAAGARRRDVWVQFLVEALTLCLLGSLLGIVAGGAVSVSIAELAAWPVFLGPGIVLLAVGSAVSVGVFLGFYPALKASRLNPIEALRFE